MDKKIIDEAKKLAVAEIDKYGSPHLVLFNYSVDKAIELAEKFGADKDISHLGAILADFKLGEAKELNKIEQHVKISSEASKKLLDNYDLDDVSKSKIINCVEAHHGKTPFLCKEAEIVCNADCYRFIHPKCFFEFILAKDVSNDYLEILKFAESKLEEKHNLLTLDICKQELEPYYQMFKKLITDAK